jgi:tRNA (pseudouridine54-N1)-methyltransferase
MPESTMLRFIQLLPQVSPRADFLLKDLPGSGKRIDVLCRVLAACFDWGPITWPKSKLEVIAMIGNTKSLTVRHPIEQMPKGEVGWAEVIRESLKGTPPRYVTVVDESLEDLVKRLIQSDEFPLRVLEEKGVMLSEVETIDPNTQNSFMLGDHRGFDSEAESIISRFDIQRISLGEKSYLSSHCLAAIISKFERKVS